MGSQKMLLPWRDTTVVGHLIRVWKELAAAQVAVVCDPNNSGLAAGLDRLQFPAAERIMNPDACQGMFSSIQCAARWSGWRTSVTHLAVVLGDQPHLRTATLRALLDFSARHPGKICQPARQGRPRHPVVLPRTAWAAISNCKETNLKEFLASRAAEVAMIELEDEGLDLDLDYPEDYQKALRGAG